ncbi:hypothetical protein LTS08_002189 [Lithohypha guttulata]|nr:hypothetical protein LTS08_002189 [Lithohypha guttulata]
MTARFPSPPPSRSASPEIEHDIRKGTTTLTEALDTLLEQYLEFLDRYTMLPQAQRASTLGAGRRYGQDCYDERMKAQRRVDISQESGNSSDELSYAVLKTQPPSKLLDNGVEEAKQPKADTNAPEEKVDEDVHSGPSEGATLPAVKPPKTSSASKQDPSFRDPLTWFGILAPPALRQTQLNFIHGVEELVPELATIDTRMRAFEEEIWSSRKLLNIQTDDADNELITDTGRSATVEEDKQQIRKKEAAQALRKSNLASRPVHARSQLLKLGD